jgi:hypothetical protein
MRYEDVRRPRGVESLWSYFKCRIMPAAGRRHVVGNITHLSGAMRRDIGLPEEVRLMDLWSLKDSGWR